MRDREPRRPRACTGSPAPSPCCGTCFFAALLLYLMYLRFMAVSAPPPQGEEVVRSSTSARARRRNRAAAPGEPPQQPSTAQAAAAPAQPRATRDRRRSRHRAPPPQPARSRCRRRQDAPLPEVAAARRARTAAAAAGADGRAAGDGERTGAERPHGLRVAADATPRRQRPSIAAPRTAAPTAPSVARSRSARAGAADPARGHAARDRRADDRAAAARSAPCAKCRRRCHARRCAHCADADAIAAPRGALDHAERAHAPRFRRRRRRAARRRRRGTAGRADRAHALGVDAAPSAPRPRQRRPAARRRQPRPARRAQRRAPPAGAPRAPGPKPTPAPGTWSTPTRGDDWGDSHPQPPRAASAAQQPGLYNADGSVRVADAPGSASPGEPPGTITEEIKDLDRAGTWLQAQAHRLRADHVRQVLGARTKRCCRMGAQGHPEGDDSDPRHQQAASSAWSSMLRARRRLRNRAIPNLNDQPADARPPPEIPFKPALQEDNGSVKPSRTG